MFQDVHEGGTLKKMGFIVLEERRNNGEDQLLKARTRTRTTGTNILQYSPQSNDFRLSNVLLGTFHKKGCHQSVFVE